VVAWGPTETNAPFPLPLIEPDVRISRIRLSGWLSSHGPPDGSPSITRNTLPTCRAHYPGGSGRVQMSVASPSRESLPRIAGGSASASRLSRPARASLALRPAGSLSRPRRPLSQGSGPPVTRTSRLPATSSTDNRLCGTSLHWSSAPSRGTATGERSERIALLPFRPEQDALSRHCALRSAYRLAAAISVRTRPT
jgi:hypothetical protein